MTGHAFQVLVEDDELRSSLAAIRSALTGDGRFVFETRNPSVREWERWSPEHAVEFVTEDGTVVRKADDVQHPVDGAIVRFTQTFMSARWARPRVSHSTLRFLDTEALASFLSETGLVIEEQFGDWARQPLSSRSPEIITIARRG